MPRAWLALLLLGVAGFAWSQSEARALIDEARALKREARVTYDQHTPDQPLWRRALELAQEAVQTAPEDLDAIRFLALTYSEVSWYVRALDVWLDYLEAGGDLEERPEDDAPPPAEAFAEAGNQLGFSRYRSGNLAAALGYYQTVLRYLPEETEALYRLGLINAELGEAEAARGYFERLLEVEPEHSTAADYLSLLAERESVGEEASQAYRQGLSAYEAGQLAASHEFFAQALSANGDFADAARWAGRTALELERPQAAVGFWERLVALRPENAAAGYFLEVARTQARWGVAAGRAYYEGQAAYAQGNLEAAASSFIRAVEANPEMPDAWVWAARSTQELGEPEEAIFYWEGALDLRPDDERARYLLGVARQQLRFGVEAGRQFAEAVRNYQLAELEQAEAGFRRTLEENPDSATAWGWLGRVLFTQADYEEAASAYRRAYELEPGNEDYAFFAEESARLAGGGS